jgi:hypothetical protein
MYICANVGMRVRAFVGVDMRMCVKILVRVSAIIELKGCTSETCAWMMTARANSRDRWKDYDGGRFLPHAVASRRRDLCECLIVFKTHIQNDDARDIEAAHLEALQRAKL